MLLLVLIFQYQVQRIQQTYINMIFYVRTVVLTLSHRYNAVRGHRTGSNNSGVEDCLRRKTKDTVAVAKTSDS